MENFKPIQDRGNYTANFYVPVTQLQQLSLNGILVSTNTAPFLVKQKCVNCIPS